MNQSIRPHVLSRMALAALFIRMGYVIHNMGSPLFSRPFLDEHYYDLCARQLAGSGIELIDGFRPLLYPFFAALFYWIDLDSGMLFTIIAQHLLGIAMTVIVAWLATRFFENSKAGIIAGLLFCLSAPPLYFEGELLIATLFSYLLLLLWVMMFQSSNSSSARQSTLLWLATGIVLGLAAQARPNALPLALIFPLITVYRLLPLKRTNGFSDTRNGHARDLASKSVASSTLAETRIGYPRYVFSTMPLLALLGLLLIQTMFGVINAQYSGRFSLLTQAGGINFYLGNSLKADGMIPKQSQHVAYEGEYRDPIQVMAEQGYMEATGKTEPLSQKDVSNYWKDRTIQEIKADPGRWIKLMMKKSWLILWNHEVPNNRSLAFAASEETPLLRWLPIHWWMLLALFPWGIAALKSKGRPETLVWISAFFVLFSATLALFFVNSRFRIPLWPGMAILGGGGAVLFWEKLKAKRIPMVPAVASILLILLSTINWFGIPPDPIENDLSMRASAYLDSGQYDKALSDIDACIELAPNNPRYPFLKGNIHLAAENSSSAVPAYLQAIALNANDPMFHNNLGIAFENMDEQENAQIAYRKALSLQPCHRAARTNLMLLLLQQGDLNQCRALLTDLLEETPEDLNLQCARVFLVYKETQDPAALAAARQLNPELVEHLLN